MSDRILSDEEKAAADRRGPAGGAQRSGPPHMRMGQPGEKASAFLPSAKRLLGLLSPVRCWRSLARRSPRRASCSRRWARGSSGRPRT